MKKISKRDLILESIIKEYIRSKAPIGSSELQSKMTLDMSPSTIRIYFKKLSDEGALVQLHVSSGRVPTQNALKDYWIKKIDISKPMVIQSVGKVQNSVKNYGLFCTIKKNKNSTFQELIKVKNRYLILAFDDEEVVLKYHSKVERFLEELIGCSMNQLKNIAFSVGLYELYSKLEHISLQNALLKEGEKELYSIAEEFGDDTFVENVIESRFYDSLDVGIYFDGFIPDGCVAIKQNALVKDDHAEMFCLGRIDSDFESFFNETKE